MHATRLLGLAVLLAGCPDRTISAVPVDQGKVEVKDIPATQNNQIDILFVIDDSPSMQDEQDSLRANFSRMIDVLETTQGGLPDVHIGVITPNLGTSAIDGNDANTIDNCSEAGESGKLRALAGTGVRFLASADDGSGTGGRTTNFTGTLQDAFSSLANVGTNGCGIEQHLESIKRATDGSNGENTGFLRAEAYLAIVIIADEDDCSLANTALWSEPTGANYGDRLNFRCTRQAVECDTPATPFDDANGPRSDCRPRDDSNELTAIERYVDHLAGLKADARDVMVAGIVGNPENFIIEKRNGVTVLGNACPAGSPQAALPAIRMGDLISQFFLNTRAEICDGDLSEPLQQVGELIKKGPDNACFDNDLLDTDGVAPGGQYDCSVVEVRRRTGQADEEIRVLGECSTGTFPCWRIEEDAAACFYTDANPHLKLVIDYNGVAVDPSIHIKSQCVTTDSSGPPL